MARSYEDYIARAESLLAAGFSTKQSQTDAIGYANNAYEIARREIQDALLSIQPEYRAVGSANWSPEYTAWNVLYDAAPFSLAHWRPKHAQVLAAYPGPVAQIEAAARLRETIKAQPVVKAAPQRTEKQREADEKARTCQICGRPIFAETGLIAHHGYQRPGEGYQTESCQGARELPFESSKAILEQHIRLQAEILTGMRIARNATAAETQPVDLSYEVTRRFDGKPIYHRGSPLRDLVQFSVTRETFADMQAAHPGYFSLSYSGRYTFDEVLSRELAQRDSRIAQQKDYLTWQRGRAAAWVLLERWVPALGKWSNIRHQPK